MHSFNSNSLTNYYELRHLRFADLACSHVFLMNHRLNYSELIKKPGSDNSCHTTMQSGRRFFKRVLMSFLLVAIETKDLFVSFNGFLVAKI